MKLSSVHLGLEVIQVLYCTYVLMRSDAKYISYIGVIVVMRNCFIMVQIWMWQIITYVLFYISHISSEGRIKPIQLGKLTGDMRGPAKLDLNCYQYCEEKIIKESLHRMELYIAKIKHVSTTSKQLSSINSVKGLWE
nr:uncharacterized protein LOC106680005 isoform X2 [Halyomorpha halys]